MISQVSVPHSVQHTMMQEALALCGHTSDSNSSCDTSPCDTSPCAAKTRSDVPIGAVIHSPKGEIIARAHNTVYASNDPTAHAEIVAIRRACAFLAQPRLDGWCLTVTLEPCIMCAGAIGWARISALFYGASDQKGGAIAHGVQWFSHNSNHHRCAVHRGVMSDQCGAVVSQFFQRRRGERQK